MARISTYERDTLPNDDDLLIGSEHKYTVNGVSSYDTKTYKLGDLATYFAGSADNQTTTMAGLTSVGTTTINTTFNGPIVASEGVYRKNITTLSATTSYTAAQVRALDIIIVDTSGVTITLADLNSTTDKGKMITVIEKDDTNPTVEDSGVTISGFLHNINFSPASGNIARYEAFNFIWDGTTWYAFR